MKLLYILLSLLFLSVSSFAVTPDEISDKSRDTMDNIRKKDQERRERILKKFYDFQNRVKNFAPDFKIKIPVDPSAAEDLRDLTETDYDSKLKGHREYNGYSADSYRLRSLPYDSDREFTAAVKRGDALTILMKPIVQKRRDKPSITRDWLLVRTSEGIEGYIPLNMVLQKKPARGSYRKHEFPDEEEILNAFVSGLNYNYLSTGGTDILLAQSGYDSGNDENRSDSSRMKVTAATLKVRGEPSLEGEVVGYLYKNDEVTVEEYSSHTDYYEGRTSKWAKIDSGGIKGWVFGAYLAPPGSDGGSGDSKNNEPAEFLKKGKTLYVKPDILRVRDAPDDMGTVLFSLQNKDEVKITDVEEEAVTLGGKKSIWVKIKYLDYDGWVFGAFLSDNRNAFEEGDDINNIFQVPITEDSYFISSKFGKRILKGKVSNHTGVDFATNCGNTVGASADGTVILAVENNRNCSSCGYGSYIILEHKNGYRTVYGHLSSIKVQVGQKVSSGQKIGTVGNTGHSYGCHLHFEIRAYEEFVDPLNYVHP